MVLSQRIAFRAANAAAARSVCSRPHVRCSRLTHSHSHSEQSTHTHTHTNTDADSHSHAHSHSHSQHHEGVPRPADRADPQRIDGTSPLVEDSTSGLSLEKARQYCTQLVADGDQPSRMITAFIPPSARDAHLALAALSITLQRAVSPSITASAAVSRIRLQYWKDTVSKILNGQAPPSEPVAILLSHVVATSSTSLSKGFLRKLVDTRTSRLGDPPFPDIASLAEFGEGAFATRLYLLGEAMPVDRSQILPLEHVYSHIGRAAGVADVLSDLPTAIQTRGRVTLPIDVMVKYDLTEEDILRRKDRTDAQLRHRLTDCVFEVATHANDQLITARTMLAEITQGKKLNDATFAPMLTAVPTKAWLENLERFDFDIFNDRLTGMRWKWTLPWKLYRAYMKKVF
ncbi:isoprenoid synthase domain-containing protein [Lipomyces japonicus]|uniref:isoprenoid synthase domain-containing protein n=1 Tax=Lipomyces japonicus TaxID=56871 RepID=UPI0034CFF1B7